MFGFSHFEPSFSRFSRRVGGRTDWVGLENNATTNATELILVWTDIVPPVIPLQPSTVEVTDQGNGVVLISGLEMPGSSVILHSGASTAPAPVLTITSATVNPVSETTFEIFSYFFFLAAL